MKIKSAVLLAELIERTQENLKQAEKFKQLPLEKLNWKNDPNTWSILECLEHLNLYGDFYLPEIEGRIRSSHTTAALLFKSGMLGNYFAESMLPKEKLNKMKTFKDKNPVGSKLDISHIDRFMEQQRKTLDLLDQAHSINLNKTKTAISISTWIKLKLGDTFRVLIYHNDRHIVQANKVLERINMNAIPQGQ